MFGEFRMLTRDKVAMGVGGILTVVGCVVAATGAGLVPGAVLVKIGATAMVGSAAASTGGAVATIVGVTSVVIGGSNTVTENTAHSKTREELEKSKQELRNAKLANQTYATQLNILSAQKESSSKQALELSQKLDQSQKKIAELTAAVANAPVQTSVTDDDFSDSLAMQSAAKMKTL